MFQRFLFASGLLMLFVSCQKVNDPVWKFDSGGMDPVVNVSQDGKYLAVGSTHHTAQIYTLEIWDLKNKKPIKEIKTEHRIVGISFSPDGQTVVASTIGPDKYDPKWNPAWNPPGADVLIWNWNANDESEPIKLPQIGFSSTVSITSDDSIGVLVRGPSQEVSMIDINGNKIKKLEKFIPEHPERVGPIFMPTEDSFIYCTNYKDKDCLTFVDLIEGTVQRTEWSSQNQGFLSGGASPDGSQIILQTGAGLKLFSSGKERELKSISMRIALETRAPVFYSPSGKYLAFGGGENSHGLRTCGTINVFKSNDHSMVRKVKVGGLGTGVWSFAFVSDNEIVCGCEDGHVRFYKLDLP